MGGTPTYDLQHLQQLIGQGELSRFVTVAAHRGAGDAGFVDADIISAVLELGHSDFYKPWKRNSVPACGRMFIASSSAVSICTSSSSCPPMAGQS